MKVLLVGLAGALASLMANRSIAVFNDAVRPLTPEFVEGRMKRREFFLTTFGLSFGLVIGFGIPFSLTSPIILVHSLFLGTDILGAALDRKSTRLNSSHVASSYAVFCLKKKIKGE